MHMRLLVALLACVACAHGGDDVAELPAADSVPGVQAPSISRGDAAGDESLNVSSSLGTDDGDGMEILLRQMVSSGANASSGRRRARMALEGLVEAQRQVAMKQFMARERAVRDLRERAARAPATFMGGVVIPLLLVGWILLALVRCVAPATFEGCVDAALAAADGPLASRVRGVVGALRRRGWELHDVTRICVSSFFLHEGLAVVQLKSAQFAASMEPVLTPLGLMRSIPDWEKGDACDLVLLFSAACTMLGTLPEVGLVLLFFDVLTDTIDLLARMAIVWLMKGEADVNELAAKKICMLGVMALVTTHRWRRHRPPSRLDVDDAEKRPVLPASVLLLGRLLIFYLFWHVVCYELLRLLSQPRLSDIDPDDPHNIVWPKVVELAFAVPFALGWNTTGSARALACVLVAEAVTCWQFWRVAEPLNLRLHYREHFTVNVAVAGGLLLVGQVGGGRYAVDELLKKRE